ncbi:295_t:CDS:1 [Scutellospora calospora]|uniref:295_t:CDS:1 n=1 Tax=Scutellospora calospora TaxID=85575 RepID=A0ACA9N3X9_9GLOM|nr:295_t:CDS:1 [Scutellospora calospora]
MFELEITSTISSFSTTFSSSTSSSSSTTSSNFISQLSSQIFTLPTLASEIPAYLQESVPPPSYNEVIELNHILE